MTISYKYLDTYSVGSIARTLWKWHDWDWDASYCAAYAYKHRKATTRTPAQALADMQRSKCVWLTNREIAVIEKTYREIKTGQSHERT